MASMGQHIMGSSDTGMLSSLASWRRPRSYWGVTVCHLPLALISGIALLLPNWVALGRLPLIPCTFLHLTGFPCPFCGVTRSFWAIVTGEWGYALANCPLAFGVFTVVIGMFVWNTAAMMLGVVISPEPLLKRVSTHRLKIGVAIAMVVAMNWAYRLFMGFDL